MPIDKELNDKKFPMEWFTGEVPETVFMKHLNAIHVDLIEYTSPQDLVGYGPQFGLATWEARPHNNYSPSQRLQFLEDLFDGNINPTIMETIQFVFQISYIDYIDVTHLIRHRTMSFSAHCTGDRDQRHDAALVKPSIANSEYFNRYMSIVRQAKQLYADMLDSREISVLDARTILPRCLENHYYARVNLKDFLHFVKLRTDRQIQPESDNILALRMLIEVARIYPQIKRMVHLDSPDHIYVKTAQQDHSSNLYQPEPRNDIFHWKPQWFVYPRQRSEMLGGEEFMQLWDRLRKEYDSI